MRQFIIALWCVMLLSSVAVYGQRKPNSRERAERKARIERRAREQVDIISEEVDLTKKQKKELFEHYSKIEAEREREWEAEQRKRERIMAERNKRKRENEKELERILGENKFEKHKRKRVYKGADKREKVMDNFLDFLGDTFELDRKQRKALREYYRDQEKSFKDVIKQLEKKQKDLDKILKEHEKKMNDIFGKEDREDVVYTPSNLAI